MKKVLIAAAFICASSSAFSIPHYLTNNIFVNIDPSYEGEPPGVYITVKPSNNNEHIPSPGQANVGIINSGMITVYNIPPGTQCVPDVNCTWSLPQNCIDMINTPDKYNGPVVITGFVSPDITDGITTLTNLACGYQY